MAITQPGQENNIQSIQPSTHKTTDATNLFVVCSPLKVFGKRVRGSTADEDVDDGEDSAIEEVLTIGFDELGADADWFDDELTEDFRCNSDVFEENEADGADAADDEDVDDWVTTAAGGLVGGKLSASTMYGRSGSLLKNPYQHSNQITTQ